MTLCCFGGGSGLLFAHRVALQRESIAVMNQSVEDGIGQGGVLEIGVPLFDR